MISPLIKKPVWISHRGFKVNAVENTFNAFAAAVDMGFSALETDLRITKDRHIVLIHDKTLCRLANDHRQVIDLTRRELESIRLANGEQFFFFEQFAQKFSHCSWTLDIKPENGKETILTLAAWTEKNDFSKQLSRNAKFLTWKPSHEKLLKSFFPRANCYAKKNECWQAGLSVLCRLPALGSIKPGRTYALPPFLGGILLYKKSIVRYFHQRNAKTIAFLPDTDVLTQQAVTAGFDEILTNGPVLY
jgi:glycerophosphoryl diester phosphodiesterase